MKRGYYISEVNGSWYAFEGDSDRNQVYSIGRDNPKDGGRWIARWCDSGIRYVASPSSSKAAAAQKARRAAKASDECDYCGVV